MANRKTPRSSRPAGTALVRVAGNSNPALPRIGKYEMTAEIGHGTRIKAFQAFDPAMGRPVTLKILTDVADTKMAERFRRDVSGVANAGTGSLVAVYELGEHVGLPFATFQYLGDETLRLAIDSRRPLTLFQKVLAMWQIAEGLQAAYSAGLGYVGLRPSGVVLAERVAKIQDFGVVRLAGDGQDEEAFYRAPEQLAGRFRPDSLCDIFAFGVVYYEFLMGSRPFSTERGVPNETGSSRNQRPSIRERLPECPEALERLVYRALETDRELRYQTWDDIQYDADPILRDLKRSYTAGLLADVARLMEAQDLDSAQSLVREILELDPDNPNAYRLRTELRGRIDRRAVEVRVDALLRDADLEVAASRLGRAVELLEAAARLDQASSEVKSRLEQTRARLAQSERSSALIAQAEQLFDQQRLAEAHDKASEAVASDPQNAPARKWLETIDAALRRQEKDTAIEEDLARAKSLLLEEAFDDALTILTDLRDQCPDSEEIRQWLEHVETQKAKAERQARLEAQRQSVGSLVAQGRIADAVPLLEQLTAEFPEDEPLSTLLLEAREQMERDARVATAVRTALDEAQWLADSQRLDLAAQLLRAKAAEFPNDPSVASRLAAIEELLPGWEKSRLVQDALGRARDLEQSQQWSVALAVLEEALQIDPSSKDALEAAERLRTRLREQERRRKLQRRLDAIGQKVAAEAWPQALSLLEAAQAEFPGESEIEALLPQVRDGLRRAESERVAAEVRQSLADDEIEQAEQILLEGAESLPEASRRALEQELEAKRKFRDEWRTAQVLFGRRQFQQAEEILIRLAAPNRPDVEALLEKVREATAATEEDLLYQRGREKALKLIQKQEFQQASDLLRSLLSLFPADPILERDLWSIPGGQRIPSKHKVQRPSSDRPPATAQRYDEEWRRPGRERPPAAPSGSSSRISNVGSPRWAASAAAALLVLVSASAAVWRLSHSGSPAAKPVSVTQAAPSALRSAPEPDAPVQSPASVPPGAYTVRPEPLDAAPVEEKPATKPVPPQPRRSFVPPPLNTNPPEDSAALLLPPPNADPTSVRQAPALPVAVGEPPRVVPPPESPKNDPGAGTGPKASSGGKYVPAKLLSRPLPILPAIAKQRGLYGVVTLSATVDKQGAVSNVKVVSGYPALGAAARDAVLKSRYQPATLDGQPIESSIQIEVSFERK